MRGRRRTLRWGLRAHLAIGGLLAVLPYLGLVVYTGSELEREAHSALVENLQRFVSVFSDMNQDIVDSSRNYLLSVERFANATNLPSTEARIDLRQLLLQRSELVGGGLLRPNGAALNASTAGLSFVKPLKSSSFYDQVIDSRGIVVGKILRDPTTGQEVIPIGSSIEDHRHKVTDVAYVLVGIEQLQHDWGRLLSGFAVGTKYVVLKRDGGSLLGESSAGPWGRVNAEESFGLIPKPGEVLTTSRPDGVLRIWWFSAPVKGNLLGSRSLVGLGVPKAAVDGPVLRAAIRNAVGLSTTALILFALAFWLVENRAVRPLRSALKTIVELGEGNFGARTNAGEFGGQIGRLVQSVDATAELLQHEEIERRRLFDSLAESEARYRTLVDASADGILLVDSEMKIVAANNAIATMVGADLPESLNGKSFFDLVDTEYHESLFRERQDRNVSLVPSVVVEVQLVAFDGDHFPAELSVARAPILDGRPEQFVVIARDVRERLRLEEDKQRLNEQLMHSQKMESVGLLAGGVAHDFNNLLTVIHGYIAFSRQDAGFREKVLGHLNEIEKAAKRAEDLTRQLLLFSRRTPIRRTTIDIRRLVEGLAKMLRRLIGENVELLIDVAETPMFVLGDTGSIEQTIVNLVVNARDAMPDGGRLNIRLSNRELTAEYAKARSERTEGRYIVVEVEDTGHGIPAEILANIFEPFFTTKARGRGTGLGLSVVFGVMQQHGGWIDVRSGQGEGTLFELWFPEAPKSQELFGSQSASLETFKARGERILVVEDDDLIRDLATQVLSGRGFRVLSASNKREAEKIIADGSVSFDLLVSDFVLPDGNGLEVATIMRNAHPGVLVLFCSGYIDDERRIPDLERQGYPLLRKPFTIEGLVSAVGTLLDRRRSST